MRVLSETIVLSSVVIVVPFSSGPMSLTMRDYPSMSFLRV